MFCFVLFFGGGLVCFLHQRKSIIMEAYNQEQSNLIMCWCRDIIEGLPRVLGNNGTLAKYAREEGNMSLFLVNRGTKLC